MATILDAWALMAYFEDEPAAPVVEQLLETAQTSGEDLLLTAVNWGEIFYSVARTSSITAAEEAARLIAAMPIRIIAVPDDLILVRQVAIFKIANRMSYADCFAAALAKLFGGTLVTGDEEFRPLEGEFPIQWLPRK